MPVLEHDHAGKPDTPEEKAKQKRYALIAIAVGIVGVVLAWLTLRKKPGAGGSGYSYPTPSGGGNVAGTGQPGSSSGDTGAAQELSLLLGSQQAGFNQLASLESAGFAQMAASQQAGFESLATSEQSGFSQLASSFTSAFSNLIAALPPLQAPVAASVSSPTPVSTPIQSPTSTGAPQYSSVAPAINALNPPPGTEVINYNTTPSTPLVTATATGITDGSLFSYGGNPDQAQIVAQTGLGTTVTNTSLPYSLPGALPTDITYGKTAEGDALWSQLLSEGATQDQIVSGLQNYVTTYSGQSGYVNLTQDQLNTYLQTRGIAA